MRVPASQIIPIHPEEEKQWIQKMVSNCDNFWQKMQHYHFCASLDSDQFLLLDFEMFIQEEEAK